MGAIESRETHFRVRIHYVDNREDEGIYHTGVDLVDVRACPSESLESLCFRVEEFVWEYAINLSMDHDHDHPEHVLFSLKAEEVHVPPIQEDHEKGYGLRSLTSGVWKSYPVDGCRFPLNQIISRPEDQPLTVSGQWFAATHCCQSLAFCAGPKLRREPDHDGGEAEHEPPPPPPLPLPQEQEQEQPLAAAASPGGKGRKACSSSPRQPTTPRREQEEARTASSAEKSPSTTADEERSSALVDGGSARAKGNWNKIKQARQGARAFNSNNSRVSPEKSPEGRKKALHFDAGSLGALVDAPKKSFSPPRTRSPKKISSLKT